MFKIEFRVALYQDEVTEEKPYGGISRLKFYQSPKTYQKWIQKHMDKFECVPATIIGYELINGEWEMLDQRVQNYDFNKPPPKWVTPG